MRNVFITLLPLLVYYATAFTVPGTAINKVSTSLDMGFFDGLFGGGKKAAASHILLKGPRASQQCEKIKMDIYKKALGRGDPKAGVEPAKLVAEFAAVARSKSTCPSSKSGGSLGSFGPGQMVPEFDKVVFNEQVGMIHGPVETQFGSHLILITNRD